MIKIAKVAAGCFRGKVCHKSVLTVHEQSAMRDLNAPSTWDPQQEIDKLLTYAGKNRTSRVRLPAQAAVDAKIEGVLKVSMPPPVKFQPKKKGFPAHCSQQFVESLMSREKMKFPPETIDSFDIMFITMTEHTSSKLGSVSHH